MPLSKSISRQRFITTPPAQILYTIVEIVSKSVVLRPRLPEGRAGKHEHGAYYLQRAELLVQEYGREYKRAYRVDVAEQRHAARGQPVHAGEVQPAGQTRIHQA